ncbi:hypothetical protein SAMN04487970_100166 [Paenibacillus tianmuensis]|uniref:DUF2524 domain-containing protein n=1 Tax=Paenibacillus tianmuensis TaxID=624147 RepID=A0A1G4P527_9BACL|nr:MULTISPECIES: DUF2524 domain-containing protein [Paenibacillus]GLI07354.1 hypothetical protein YDYSG_33840 [Paenibacillus tyrfis]SCW27268.1 hypothetical protein SAMN04487970_100166 [Paenibacillus tianmuensis]
MVDNLESNYDCSNAGGDLQELQQQLAGMQTTELDEQSQQTVNRLENQIRFIKNKCDIRP